MSIGFLVANFRSMRTRHIFHPMIVLFIVACSSVGPTVNNGAPPHSEQEASSVIPASAEVFDATAQRWTAGMHGGGSGVDYHFKVVVKGHAPMGFPTARIGGTIRKLDTYVMHGRSGSTAIEVASGDTAELSLVESSKTNTVPVHTVAMVYWNAGDLWDSITVPSIRVLPAQPRP
jgi:hypothetical protein